MHICIGLTNECPVEDLVIVYFIVQGCFNLLHLTLYALSICAKAKEERTLSTCLVCCNLIMILFLITWTIAASAWVCRSLDDWVDDLSECNSSLYKSTLIFLVLHYAVILLLCCRSTCVFLTWCKGDK